MKKTVRLIDKNQEGRFMVDMMVAWGECEKHINHPIFYLTGEQYEYAKQYYELEIVK